MLTPELQEYKETIEEIAKGYGLDFFETIFEVLNWEQICEVAARGGFPVRYPHWRFGMEYDKLFKGYAYGAQRIYEMVINNNPCYAYLLASNPIVDQKTVIGHVYAHCDFFKNNLAFEKTNRRMIDDMANHAVRVRKYIDKYGVEEVEQFIDRCLSLDNLIDPHGPFIRRQPKPKDKDAPPQELPRIKAKKYMDRYINPKEFMDRQQQKIEEEKRKAARFPPEPVRDILGFLLQHASLKEWQQDVLGIIREEAYYFAPQWQTKIMNEGWATYWHSKIMTEKSATSAEIIDYARTYAGVVAMGQGQLNPYKIGVELFRYIEERWNRGCFGEEYDHCDNLTEKLNWDRQLGLGREKIFQVRMLHNDVTFIDEFLTPEFAKEQKMFTFAFNDRRERWEIASRKFEEIKQKLLYQLTNAGQPFIYAVDGNYKNRGELLLKHQHEGVDLKLDFAAATLENATAIWGRPVNIMTSVGDKWMLFSFDGSRHERVEIEDKQAREYQPHT